MFIIGFAAVLCLGVFIIWIIYTYNMFVGKQSKIDEVWDEVEVHLKLRRDLIPELMESSKEGKLGEEAVLNRIEELGRIMAECESISDRELYEIELSVLMRKLREYVKERPDMMIKEDFVRLLGELVSMEGRASSACNRHNALVRDFNSSIKRFPATMVVRSLHFYPCEMRIFGVIEESEAEAGA